MEEKSFLSRLFDFSFTEFITTSVIKILFITAIVFSAIWAIVIFVSGIQAGLASAVLSIIAAPVVFFVGVLQARVWLEIVVVLFRICENTTKMAGTEKADEPAEPSQGL